MKVIILLLCLILACPSAYAAGQGSGKIVGYLSYPYGNEELFFIKVENTDAISCNGTRRFTLKSDNPHFKTLVGALLTAFATETPVLIHGRGTCDNFSNSEDFFYFCVGNIPC